MAFENNTPHLRNATVDATREISERRAATISRMVDEAAKRGLDDEFAYDAVADYGRDNAKEFRKTLKNPDSFQEFIDNFGTDHNREIYEMETVKKTDDELEISTTARMLPSGCARARTRSRSRACVKSPWRETMPSRPNSLM